MVRVPCCDQKLGLKKGAWTAEEDHILKSFVLKYGHGNWRTLPKRAGLARCGKGCRFRWTNYLNPTVKRGNYTKEEEETIISLHAKLGNRWSAIAAKLPGRTDNEIKNVWYTHLKKKLHNKISANAELDSKDGPSAEISPNNLGSEVSVQRPIFCDKGRPSIMESTSSYTSSQEESDGDFSSVASNWYNNLEETQNMDSMYHDFNKYDDLSDNIIMPEFYYDTYWSEGPFINMEAAAAAAAPGEPQHEDDLWTYESYSNYDIDIWS